jgi:hypothetical protein
MIEKLIEKNDIKKIDTDKNMREKFLEYTQAEQYLEIVENKHIMLGCRDKKGMEVLQVEDPLIVENLRILRDNFNLWQELTKIRSSAHKQFAQKFESSIFKKIYMSKLDKNTINDSYKLCKKLHSLTDKMAALHDRLQGVFFVHGKKKEIVGSVDIFDSIICYKIENLNEPIDLSWAKDVKYAKIMIVAPEDRNLIKALKTYCFEKLQLGRKKSKNIWLKNHK